MRTAKTGGTSLASRFADVRTRTERLAARLTPEDQAIQSMPDASPTKWHRAHTTWFFETFVLGPHADGYEPFDPAFGFLFNSYYEVAGPRHTRAARGMISRPGIEEVAAYRRHVDAAIGDLLTEEPEAAVAELIELGLHHEQQHQELILMDIKHLFSLNPIAPAYGEGMTLRSEPAPAHAWIPFDAGIVGIGHLSDGFSFDNELPRHDALLRPFALTDRLVTCGEWLEFMADGGYENPLLWLSDGWHTVNQRGWHAPEYWRLVDGEWSIFTLHGTRPVDPGEPVCHLSYYEADAFAAWADARLPTEAEWEHAASTVSMPAPRERALLHPDRSSGDGLQQMFGEAWQWTASPYTPYPGFRTASGAVGEYNGKFMVNTWVLRGGCCATPAGHIRATYRNFFHPATRWHFSGLRLARDEA